MGLFEGLLTLFALLRSISIIIIVNSMIPQVLTYIAEGEKSLLNTIQNSNSSLQQSHHSITTE